MLKLASSSDSQKLTNEELVRLKHKLEDNIKWFLAQLTFAELREIELVTAKMLDAAEKVIDPSEKKSFLLKAELLRVYHEMRQNRKRRFKSIGRVWHIYNTKIFLEDIIDSKLVPPGLKLDELPNNSVMNDIVSKLST